MDPIICGHCGKAMTLREVTPCLDCGGDPKEVAHLKSGQHYFLTVELFGGEVLCDFCYSDIQSTDPLYWGFPHEFDWEKNLYTPSQETNSQKIEDPQPSWELACADEKCRNTLRKQQFIVQNARHYGVVLPNRYWPSLSAG